MEDEVHEQYSKLRFGIKENIFKDGNGRVRLGKETVRESR